MDFDLNDEQRQLQETIRRFLAERCPAERVREIMESDSGHDGDLWKGLADLGVPALLVPEAHGGLASEFLDAALVAEEIGFAAVPGPYLSSTMATVVLKESEDDESKARWLPKLAGGEAIGAVAIGEGASEWAPDRLRTRAEADRLSGDKPLVLFAAVSDVLIVAAHDGEGPGLWLVERNGPGVTISALRGNDMTRRLDAVTLDGAPGRKLGGAELLARTMDAGSILLAADAYGGARRCLEMTTAYALEREQFGQVIGAFQGVKHQLADMACELEPMLALVWYAAHAFDRRPEQTSRHAAMAKAQLADVFDRIASRAIELHGGIGFTWEFDLHLWFRRALFDRSYLGEAAFHRERAATIAGW